MSERFRSLWVHSQFSSAEGAYLNRPTVKRARTRNHVRIYMAIVGHGGHTPTIIQLTVYREVEMFETWATQDKVRSGGAGASAQRPF